MANENLNIFGKTISRLINKENLSYDEAYEAFSTVLNNQTTEIQQGAFLAALKAKGESRDEIAGCREAIYKHDTNKVNPQVDRPVVENSGTGMDSFKTFNISTCASIIAATANIPMARHGSRALTGVCGTVDLAEHLGVDVECSTKIIVESLEKTNLGLFNGMSPQVHPNALGRILSNIAFGSTLNISASLASPVKPEIGVRGVYSKEMVQPTIEVMHLMGYKKALVYYGSIKNSLLGMDEASVSGDTYLASLDPDGYINYFNFSPEDAGLQVQSPDELSPSTNITEECERFVTLLEGKGHGTRVDAVALNAGLIFYMTEISGTIKEGVKLASEILESGEAVKSLQKWIAAQNRTPEKGINSFKKLKGN